MSFSLSYERVRRAHAAPTPRRLKKPLVEKNKTEGEDARRGRKRGEEEEESRFVFANRTQAVSLTVYDDGVCIAPCGRCVLPFSSPAYRFSFFRKKESFSSTPLRRVEAWQ